MWRIRRKTQIRSSVFETPRNNSFYIEQRKYFRLILLLLVIDITERKHLLLYVWICTWLLCFNDQMCVSVTWKLIVRTGSELQELNVERWILSEDQIQFLEIHIHIFLLKICTVYVLYVTGHLLYAIVHLHNGNLTTENVKSWAVNGWGESLYIYVGGENGCNCTVLPGLPSFGIIISKQSVPCQMCHG